MNFQKNSKFGFTLLETIIALFVITVGLLGGMVAVERAVLLTSLSSSKLRAAYLAQEGIEIIRNIRDINWLEARTISNSWDEGLTHCSAGCIADYNHSYGPDQIDPNLPVWNNQFLNSDANGFYSYSSGSATKFQRKITVTSPSADILEILVEIIWQERGKSYSFSVKEHLYKWY